MGATPPFLFELRRGASLLPALATLAFGPPLLAQARDGSMGARVVHNTAPDRALDWSVQSQRVLGSTDQAPDAFFRIYPWTVAADAAGRVYILDVGEFRVSVFDSVGRFQRTVGARGGGPGEFLSPLSIAVSPAGEVIVVDRGKAALVRFAANGEILEERRLPDEMAVLGAIAIVGQDTIAALSPPNGQPDAFTSLERLGGDSIAQVVAFRDERTVGFKGCSVRLGRLRPLFAPTVVWGARTPDVAFNASTEYEIVRLQASRPQLVIRRAVAPLRVDRADALRSPEVRNGMTISYPDGMCRITPEDALEARGFTSVLSPVKSIVIAPDRSLWVLRRRPDPALPVIDVFSLNGIYLGTLSQDVPFPVTFLNRDIYIALGRNELGAPVVTYNRLVRDNGN